MESCEYNVEVETQFNREKLSAAIPERLQELLDTIHGRNCNAEEWYTNLLTKLLIGVARICQDLLHTTNKEALPAAAWNARNLLEIWVWIKYCSVSRANARRFHEDALRDMFGMAESLSKMHETAGVRNDFEAAFREKATDVAAEWGIYAFDSNYLRVMEAAKSVGLDNWYGPCNAQLSKFAHPTAGLIIGILHQDEKIPDLQCVCTTVGVYFAGQCAIALSEAISTL